MASNPEETSPKKGVSIINKALPSFGSDKQLEASIGKQVRIAQKKCWCYSSTVVKAIFIIRKHAFKDREWSD